MLSALWPSAANASPGQVPEARHLLDQAARDIWETPPTDNSKVSLADGVLRLKSQGEWILTKRQYSDLELRFEAMAAPGAVGGILVRALQPPAFARAAYEVQIADGHGRAGILLQHLNSASRMPLTGGVTQHIEREWQPYRLLIRGNTLRAWVGTRQVFNVHGLAQNVGAIGFRVTKGEIAIRGLVVQEFEAARPGPPPGVMLADGDGVTLPKVVKEVRPQYDRAALAASIQGIVLVTALIGVDGRVHDVQVYQSLTPELDRQAKTAAAKWVFEPALFDGKPVAVQATISLSFAVK
jgi:TonB family protein